MGVIVKRRSCPQSVRMGPLTPLKKLRVSKISREWREIHCGTMEFLVRYTATDQERRGYFRLGRALSK